MSYALTLAFRHKHNMATASLRLPGLRRKWEF